MWQEPIEVIAESGQYEAICQSKLSNAPQDCIS
jgi:hypothetical protein